VNHPFFTKSVIRQQSLVRAGVGWMSGWDPCGRPRGGEASPPWLVCSAQARAPPPWLVCSAQGHALPLWLVCSAQARAPPPGMPRLGLYAPRRHVRSRLGCPAMACMLRAGTCAPAWDAPLWLVCSAQARAPPPGMPRFGLYAPRWVMRSRLGCPAMACMLRAGTCAPAWDAPPWLVCSAQGHALPPGMPRLGLYAPRRHVRPRLGCPALACMLRAGTCAPAMGPRSHHAPHPKLLDLRLAIANFTQ
jgi:hypothetical protein